jgi:hypothetical protein
MSTPGPFAVASALVVLSLAATPIAFQNSRSAAAAKELVQLLEAGKLDSIAAADPSDPNAFVAALYITGSQLLVVSAKYAAPALLTAKIKSREYRDVYIDLSAASVAGTKVFLIDQNCDGLFPRPGDNGAPDTWEAGPQQISFDGEWRRAKMTEEAYMKAFAEADERYARMMSLLVAQAKQ